MIVLLQNKYIKKYLQLTFGIILIFFVSILFDFDEDKINKIFENFNYFNLSFAIFLYLLSHSVRVFRLFILNPETDYSIIGLWRAHYKANGVNLLLPFKLGETYRVIYFSTFLGSYSNSLAVLFFERFLDLLTIFLILLFCNFFSPLIIQNLNYLLLLTFTLFLIITLICYTLENLTNIINRFIFKKKLNIVSNFFINSTNSFNESMKLIKKILNKKYVLCLTSSFLIWLLEISAFFIFFDALNNEITLIIFLALAVALSSILPNGPIGYGGVQLAFYSVGTAANNPDLVNYSFIYSVFIFGSGLIVASILFIYEFLRFDENV